MKGFRGMGGLAGFLIFTALILQFVSPTCINEDISSWLPASDAGHRIERADHGGADRATSSSDDTNLCWYQCGHAFIKTLPGNIAFYTPALAYIDPPKDFLARDVSRTIFQPPRNIV